MRPKITGDEEELVEQAAEEHSTKTAAVNHAIRQTFGDSDEVDDDEPAIDPKIERAHRKLWDNCIGNRMELTTATSILAQDMQIDADAIKASVIPKLQDHDLIRVQQGNWSVSVVVSQPDPTDIDEEPAIEQLNRELTDDEDRAYRAVWSESDEGARISIDDAIDTISDTLEIFDFKAGETIMQLAEANAITVYLRDSQICVRDPNRDPNDVPDTEEDIDDQLDAIDAAEPTRAQTDGGRDLTDEQEER